MRAAMAPYIAHAHSHARTAQSFRCRRSPRHARVAPELPGQPQKYQVAPEMSGWVHGRAHLYYSTCRANVITLAFRFKSAALFESLAFRIVYTQWSLLAFGL